MLPRERPILALKTVSKSACNDILCRVARFLRGTIEVIYATTMTGWHSKKALGFTLTLNESLETVNMSAPDSLSQLCDSMLKDSVTFTPKHAMTAEFEGIAPGVVPDVGDPECDPPFAPSNIVV